MTNYVNGKWACSVCGSDQCLFDLCTTYPGYSAAYHRWLLYYAEEQPKKEDFKRAVPEADNSDWFKL